MQSRITAAALLVACALVLASCATDNSDEATETFEKCTNGILDAGEQCDDGNRIDTDSCLSSCKLPTCGDEFVRIGVEECDGRNLDAASGNFHTPFTCADVGFAAGTLSCTADCRFDTSACGARFTPTPTITSTPTGEATATPSPSPSPTPTRNPMCGNRTVEPGETCDDGNTDENDSCPNDCRIEPCTPDGNTVSLQVDFAPPQFQDASSITLLIKYPDGQASLPGTGGEASVGSRITGRQTGSTVTANDFDHALRVVYTRPGRINPGRVFLLGFDECTGTTMPTTDQFICEVVGCSNSSGPLEGCSCSVAEP